MPSTSRRYRCAQATRTCIQTLYQFDASPLHCFETLPDAASATPSGGSAESFVYNVPVDVVFDSEAARGRREAILRARFPTGRIGGAIRTYSRTPTPHASRFSATVSTAYAPTANAPTSHANALGPHALASQALTRALTPTLKSCRHEHHLARERHARASGTGHSRRGGGERRERRRGGDRVRP